MLHYIALQVPSSLHICWHPQPGSKLKEGNRISHKADEEWAIDHNYPKFKLHHLTLWTVRMPMLSNVPSQLLMFLSTGRIQTPCVAEVHTQWLLNSCCLKTLHQYLHAAAELYNSYSSQWMLQQDNLINVCFVLFLTSIIKTNHTVRSISILTQLLKFCLCTPSQ